MSWNVTLMGIAGFVLAISQADLRADLKVAAGVLKSTVAVEWVADPPAKPKATSETGGDADSNRRPADVAQKPPGEQPRLAPPSYVRAVPPLAFTAPPNWASPNQRLRLTGTTAGISVPSVVSGCGVVVDSEGLIVTSLPASRAGKFTVTLEDGRKLTATQSVLDQRSGLMLLKIEARELPAVSLALEPVEPGAEVVAGVCPDSRTRSLRRGIITGQNRTVTGPCAELIQTDVEMDELSNGAPLVNTAGQLVGIMTSTDESESTGLSYAVPARFVKMLLAARPEADQLVIRKGFLGIQLATNDETPGNVVDKVFEGSPAAKAGIKEKDEILQINGQVIRIPKDVVRVVSDHRGGEKIKVLYRRDGEESTVEVTLSEFPGPLELPVTVNVVQPPKVLLWSPEGGYSELLITPDAVAAPSKSKPPLDKVPDGKSSEQVKKIYELYNQAARAQADATTTLRVERSDLNQKLDELKTQVDSLKTEVTKLHKVLEQLEKKLGSQ